jgi:hypothetical protein
MSVFMSLSAVITPAALYEVIGNLAPLFLRAASGDLRVARQAAARLLAAYEAETAAELRLAADILGLSFHALDARERPMVAELPGDEVRRLHACVADLGRQAQDARHRLDWIRRDRQPVAVAAEIPAAADSVVTREAAGLIASARRALANRQQPPNIEGHDDARLQAQAGTRTHAARRIADTFAYHQARLDRREALASAGQGGLVPVAAVPRDGCCPIAASA